jgi:Nif-specific regulatory protein
MTKEFIMSNETLPASIERLRLLYEVAVEMNRSHSTRELLEIILGKCTQLVKATTGSVMLINSKEGLLEIMASKGIHPEVAKRTRLKIGEGVTGWVAKHGKPRLVNDIAKDPFYVMLKSEIQSELAVPIKTDSSIKGVISVDSSKRNAFSEDDKNLLLMIAELAAQILAKDEIQESLESKVRSQQILISIIESIERKNDLTEVFNITMEALSNHLNIIRGMLVLFDPSDPGSLKIVSGYRISEEAKKLGIYRIGEGIIGTAVAEGKTIAVKDISKDSKFLNKMKIKRSFSNPFAFIAAPIKLEEQVIGVLAVEKIFETEMAFDDTVNTLTLLASIIAYKVKNFQELQERTRKLIDENQELKKALKTGNTSRIGIIGQDIKIQHVLEQIHLTANTLASVLVTGETGTGKELVARALHQQSDRKEGPFVAINCSSVPENLLEAELFGYQKGAFTGAYTTRKGKFELADKGTLFLDEIGEMPLHLQAKILRVLQEKEIQPLGTERTIKVDIRVISATNRDLKKMVDENRFRSDLFFRLNVINIHLPPLRERRDDIMILTSHFIKRYNAIYEKEITGLNREAERLFLEYSWPGNIRELENVVERAVILCKGSMIDLAVLPESVRNFKSELNSRIPEIDKWMRQEILAAGGKDIHSAVIGKLEKKLIEEVLINQGANKSRTASMLGINRNTLKAKMREYGIKI